MDRPDQSSTPRPGPEFGRRQFLRGIAAGFLTSRVYGAVSADGPEVLTGDHFDLTIEAHQVNFTGRRGSIRNNRDLIRNVERRLIDNRRNDDGRRWHHRLEDVPRF